MRPGFISNTRAHKSSATGPALGALLRDARGSIAVEFALVAPVLMVVLAGVIDIGSAAHARLSLQARVTAATEYALLQPAPPDQPAAADMAQRLVGLLQGGGTTGAEAVVNNAASAAWSEGAVTPSAGPGAATACYCPALSGGAVDWGSPVVCDTPCAAGGTAGPFVRIAAQARHVSLFPAYGFVAGDTLQASAVLRLN
ncbi:TadE/TadG family type IV pilus assembly protein [Roseovarius sp. D22-M7]|uniref:TadE/TadG family type IV pilus assembly protein n=1 Tax=Roseovarius sp. D22-M7 TaxID=3127116 RepID=UPI0030101B76